MNNMKKEQEEQGLKSEEVYIDSNVFIYAFLDMEKEGVRARKIFEDIKKGKYKKAFTSTLTFDEFLWCVQKQVGKELAAEGATIFFNFQNLELISIDSQMALEALKIYKNEKLKPRDAIHVAAMKSKNISRIISTDSDFDEIKDIQRIDFTK